MSALPLHLTQADYARASSFVLAHLRRAGVTPTSLRPLTAIAVTLYLAALFVILVGPNYIDGTNRTIIRASVGALVFVPVLFGFAVWRLRIADARALYSLAPQPEEKVTVRVTAGNIEVFTESMTANFQWKSITFFVVDPDFAVLLAPRMAPLPITPAACTSEGQFLDFLRITQQYRAHHAT